MIMKFDYRALKTLIKQRFGTYRAFASALKVSEGTLNRWLNNKTPIRLEALRRMVELLEIPDREIDSFFFCPLIQDELPRRLVKNTSQMRSDYFALFVRYAVCLLSLRENHSAEAIQADNQLQASLKTNAPLSEIVQRTEALELALGIRPTAPASA